jgi:hypothetical protein
MLKSKIVPNGELAAASESIEPACKAKAPLSTKPERDFEAGAGIEPANRFTDENLSRVKR